MPYYLQIALVCIALGCRLAWDAVVPGSDPSGSSINLLAGDPADTQRAELEEPLAGIASWYGDELKGRPTASGEPFDPNGLTAASWHHPIGAIVEVTRPDTGKSVRVRINDRGPAHRLNRLIDLSHASFKRIADPDIGLVEVEVELVALPYSAMRSEFALSQ